MVIETIKQSESGDGIIIRVYESQGKNAICSIKTALEYYEAVETDLMENEIHEIKINDISFSPFEIKTIKLKWKH